MEMTLLNEAAEQMDKVQTDRSRSLKFKNIYYWARREMAAGREE